MAMPLEIPVDWVEEYAQAARRKIDSQLEERDCPEFWVIVAKLYARGLADETPSRPAVSGSSLRLQ
jgi:hypothetical protein